MFDKVIFCPKCNSNEVEIYILNPPEKKRISMDDLPTAFSTATIPAVHRIIHYKATCKNCGYEKTWSS